MDLIGDFHLDTEKSVSIVIPALNEEQGIRDTILSLPLDRIRANGYHVEVLVIDGNSSDKTKDMASQLGAEVIVEGRKGYGRAYKTGFSFAKGQIIVTLDADGTYPCEMIPELISELLRRQLDFISVNRFAKLEDGAMSKTHLIGNFILSASLRMLYSLRISDSQSGMWVMTKDLVDKVNLLSEDMAFSEEIKIVAFSYFKSAELAGRYSKRVGQAKLATIGHGWRNLKYLWNYKNKARYALKPSFILNSPQLRR
jgi:glycosyltransferase involved in cell wall biosynthesis